MTIPSPIHEDLVNYEVQFDMQQDKSSREGAASGEFHSQLLSEFLQWGDGECTVLATTGIVELEYAAIQKSVGLFDASCRGTIKLTGEDRLSFIDRMTTQKLEDVQTNETRLAFIVSRKGSIVGDVIVRNLSDHILIDLDVTATQQVCDHLQTYIVMDDVQVEDVTPTVHWFWCIGPDATSCTVENAAVHTLPEEFLGLKGIAIAVEPEHASSVWRSLVEGNARPIGWYALNMSRVEQGRPMFMIDFDTNNLPHETSLIQSRVRFDKGCYLGQEIVARLENLGQPKQRLVQLEMETDDLPIAGSQIWDNADNVGTPVGVVTSSAVSPMGGGVPAVIGMVSKKNAVEQTTLYTYVGTTLAQCKVAHLRHIQQGEPS